MGYFRWLWLYSHYFDGNDPFMVYTLVQICQIKYSTCVQFTVNYSPMKQVRFLRKESHGKFVLKG